MLITFGAASARADVVAVAGKTPMINVEITGLRDARLHFRSAGRDAAQDIAQVEYLQVSGWDLFNLAEQQQRKGDWRSAIAGYERAFVEMEADSRRPAAGTESQGLDRELLLKCRLLRAYEAQDRFERVIELFIEVVERSPGLLGPLRPARLPAAGSPEIEVALSRLDEAIRRHQGDAIGAGLTRWRATWPVAQSRPAGPDAALPPPPAPKAAVDEQLQRELREVRRLVEAGTFDEALERLSDLAAATAGPARADVFYWQGRSWSGKSETAADDPATAARDRRRAGLAFMRVVIHFPRDPLAPECLFRAAALCRRDGLEPQARRLWSELTVLGAETPWAEQARKELQKTGSTAAAANPPAGGRQAR